MAIADQISRISNAKDEIRTAIEAAGTVTVGNGTIDTYPAKIQELVQSLSGGSGGSSYSGIKIDLENYVGGTIYPYWVEEVTLSSSNPITSLNSAFKGSNKLKRVDLSGLNLNSVTDILDTFANCSILEYIDISTLNIESVTNKAVTTFGNVPRDCLIYVKDEATKTSFESYWTTLTNVQVKPSAISEE